jgi:hypothetical protein
MSTTTSAASMATSLIPPPTQIDNTHRVYSIAITCIVLGILASITVVARLAQRLHAKSFGPDDFAIIPGLVSEPDFYLLVQILTKPPAFLHRLDGDGGLRQPARRSRKAVTGDYPGRIFDMVSGNTISIFISTDLRKYIN